MAAFILNGCSLFKIDLETAEPMSQQALSKRLLTRQFIPLYFNTLQDSANDIYQASDDKLQRNHVINWKLNSEAAAINAVYQSDPTIALADLMTLVRQQLALAKSSVAAQNFGRYQQQVIDTSQQLLEDADQLSLSLNNEKAHNNLVQFSEQQAANYPLEDFNFQRGSIYSDWISFNNIDPALAATNQGTLPQVMSDMSEKMSVYSQQMPKTLIWKAQMYSNDSELDVQQINSLLQNLNTTSLQLMALTKDDPERIARISDNINAGVDDVLLKFSDTLQSERQALSQGLAFERENLKELMSSERVLLMADVDKIAESSIVAVFEQIKSLIKSVIVYVILFVIVLLFLPFGFGFFIGKKLTQRKQ
jgi:hypothetical protein